MGILSANLVFNSNSQLLYSSLSNFRRRISSPPPAAVKSNNKPNTLLIQHFKSVNYNPEYRIRSPPYNYSIIPAEKSWTDHHSLCNNPFSGLGKYYLDGSCNELLLLFLCDSSGERIALWDPKTNKIIKILPRSDVQVPRSPAIAYTQTLAHGFGFDPESEDYKVLRFILFGYKNGRDSYYDAGGFTHVELYSLKTNSWKKITNPLRAPPIRRPSIYVNGIYYWMDLSHPPKILSFDFANEKFSYIPRPPKLVKKFVQFDGSLSEFDYVPVEFDGSLAALVHSEPGNEEPFSFKIWGWNGESWLERMPITTIDAPGVYEVLGLFQDHKLFLQGFFEGELMLFDLAKNKPENLGIHADPYKMDIFPYVSVPQWEQIIN